MSVLLHHWQCVLNPRCWGRVIEEAKLEAAEFNKTYEWYPQRMGRGPHLAEGQARVSSMIQISKNS